MKLTLIIIIQNILRYKVEECEDGQQRTRKIKTVVTTGRKEGNSIILSLCDRHYSLQSVLFHQGNH
jgi:hypothetical protein